MLINVIHPANATVFIAFLFDIASFEVFDNLGPTFEGIFKFESSPAILPHWDALGY